LNRQAAKNAKKSKVEKCKIVRFFRSLFDVLAKAFQIQLDGLAQVRLGFFDRLALADDAQYEAMRDVPIGLASNDGGQSHGGGPFAKELLQDYPQFSFPINPRTAASNVARLKLATAAPVSRQYRSLDNRPARDYELGCLKNMCGVVERKTTQRRDGNKWSLIIPIPGALTDYGNTETRIE
jgi:hypothetical protein